MVDVGASLDQSLGQFMVKLGDGLVFEIGWLGQQHMH